MGTQILLEGLSICGIIAELGFSYWYQLCDHVRRCPPEMIYTVEIMRAYRVARKLKYNENAGHTNT